MNNLPQWVRDGSNPGVPGMYERLYDELSPGGPTAQECEWDGTYWYFGKKPETSSTPAYFQNKPWRDHNNIQPEKETTPMPIDFNKPVQTREGRPARVICTDKKGSAYPVWALVMSESGHEEDSHSYTLNGRYFDNGDESEHDLMNVPVRTERFINFYDGQYDAYSYATLDGANNGACAKRTCVIKVMMEDGKAVSSELVAQ